MQNYLLAYVMLRNGNRQRLEFSVAEVILISAVPRYCLCLAYVSQYP